MWKDEKKHTYFIHGLPTSPRTLGRYSWCTSMGVRRVPTYDFDFEVVKGPAYSYANKGTITSSRIEWKVQDIIELYILAYSFGNDWVCDLAVDEWRRFALHDDWEPKPDDMAYIQRHTPRGSPFVAFLTDSLLARGRFISNSGPTLEIIPLHGGEALVAEAQIRLLTANQTQLCERYHLHTRFKEPCFLARNVGAFGPEWEAIIAETRKTEYLIDKLGDELHARGEPKQDEIDAHIKKVAELRKDLDKKKREVFNAVKPRRL